MEPDRVRGVVLSPPSVWDFLERLERIVIAWGKSRIDYLLCDPFRLADAEVGGFDERAQDALGRNRMLADVITVSRMDAAEVLRPGAGCGGGGGGRADLQAPHARGA